MQKVPEGWESCAIREKVILEYGEGLAEEKRIIGDVPVYGSNGVVGYHIKEMVRGPGIVIGRKGTVGAVNYTKENFWPIDTTYFIRFTDKENDIKWFYYVLSTLKLSSLNSATGVPGLNREDVYRIKVKWPHFFEQRAISKILTTCDEAIEKTDAKIEKLKRIKQGLMQDLFRYGIDEKGRMRSEKTHRFKDSPLGQIPVEWEVVELGYYTKKGRGGIQIGPFGSQLHANDYVDEGTPIITVEHLIDYRISHHNLPKVSMEDRIRLSKYLLLEGDSVFSRVGAIDRCSYTTKKESGWLFSGRCLRVRPGKLLNSKFLTYILNTYQPINWILNNAVGSTMKCLNTNILSKTRIAIPIETSEQSRIAPALSAVDEAIEKEEAYKNKLLAIKRGLMEDLLSGEVRVNKLMKEAV